MQEQDFHEYLGVSILRYIYHCEFYDVYTHGHEQCVLPAMYFNTGGMFNTFYLENGEVNKDKLISLTENQLLKVHQISRKLRDKNIKKYKILREEYSEYSFLFSSGDVCYPSDILSENIEMIKNSNKLLSGDFYFLYAYVGYYHNKAEVALLPYFEKLFSLDPGNPFILSYYARYLGSVLYKESGNLKFLYGAEKSLLQAISFFHSDNVPSYLYSWLGFIYTELGDYSLAEKNYNIAISINNQLGFQRIEPYIWKSYSLRKQKKYITSLNVLNFISKEVGKSIYGEDKLDFRFYRLYSENYYFLGKKDFFIESLKKTIILFLQEKDLEIGNFFLLGDGFIKNNTKGFLLNAYIAFLDYNSNIIKDDILLRQIYTLGFVYIQGENGFKIDVSNTRGLAKICYYYISINYKDNYENRI